MFPEDFSIWFVNWVKQMAFPVWAGIIQSTEDPNRTKKQKKNQFALLSWATTSPSPALAHWCYTSQAFELRLGLTLTATLVLRSSDLNWNTLLALLVIQISSREPIPIKCYMHNIYCLYYFTYLSIDLPILSVLFLWRILTNTITIIKSFHISHRTMMFLTHHFWSVAFWAEFSNSAWEICYYSPVTITNAKKWKVVQKKKRKFVEGCIWITSPYSSGILWLRASTPLITALAPPWTSEDNAGITHFIAL